MYILMICNSYPNRQYPNAYVFVHNQTQMLQKRGHHVVVMDIDLRSLRWRRKYGFWIDTYEGVVVYRMSFPFVTRSPMPPECVNWVTRRLALIVYKKMLQNGERFDLMHAHFAFASGAAAAVIKKRFGLPYVITEHSSGIHMGKKNIVKASLDCYHYADQIVTVSNVLRDALKKCGIHQRIHVIPNVVNTNRFRPDSSCKQNDVFTFLTVTRLVPEKGIDLLLTAFAQMRKQHPNIALIIAGDGDERSRLEKLAKELEISDKAMFKGMIPNREMPLIYNRADCFVLPSHNETFGMVYAEAASCGLPVIGTKCGGPEDIICEKNGLLIDRFDAKPLKAAMEKIYGDYQNYCNQKEQMHQDIETRFGETRVYQMLMQVYKHLKNEGNVL